MFNTIKNYYSQPESEFVCFKNSNLGKEYFKNKKPPSNASYTDWWTHFRTWGIKIEN